MSEPPTPSDTHALQQQIIDRFLHIDPRLATFARDVRLTLAQLGAWASQPRNTQALEALARLAELRAQLFLSSYRSDAAAKLFQIAMSNDGGESARRACVDLLKINIDTFNTASPLGDHNAADDVRFAALTPEILLATLESLGRRTEPPAPAPTSSGAADHV